MARILLLKADARLPRRDVSGLFRFGLAEGSVHLVFLDTGRRIAGLTQILFFGSVTQHTGVSYLGLLVRNRKDGLVCHEDSPCENATTLPLCPTTTLAPSDPVGSGSETT